MHSICVMAFGVDDVFLFAIFECYSPTLTISTAYKIVLALDMCAYIPSCIIKRPHNHN